ncbi:MAG: diacylglycerol kinase [Candidatus Moranbacteria bacterium CG10_big_fil_rev_8_21_14_0_10_35_21]|nr:MAG: diacylglycerol kinase [Candidatus Moranbacteria bacterium CG10_big_fil_rev_8_21_14_0_10_35_21]
MNRFREFYQSLNYAVRGLAYALKSEKNFQNEIIIGILVFIAMIYFRITQAEMVILLLVIFGVLIMELLNTVMERIMDMLKPRVHPYVKLIKDLMAASVLVASLLAIIIGLIIFIPYITG